VDQYPDLKRAVETRQLVFAPNAKPAGVIAVPMVLMDSVMGLIAVESSKLGPMMTDANARFFEVMASTLQTHYRTRSFMKRSNKNHGRIF
jgi:hypothetical protein